VLVLAALLVLPVVLAAPIQPLPVNLSHPRPGVYNTSNGTVVVLVYPKPPTKIKISPYAYPFILVKASHYLNSSNATQANSTRNVTRINRSNWTRGPFNVSNYSHWINYYKRHVMYHVIHRVYRLIHRVEHRHPRARSAWLRKYIIELEKRFRHEWRAEYRMLKTIYWKVLELKQEVLEYCGKNYTNCTYFKEYVKALKLFMVLHLNAIIDRLQSMQHIAGNATLWYIQQAKQLEQEVLAAQNYTELKQIFGQYVQFVRKFHEFCVQALARKQLYMIFTRIKAAMSLVQHLEPIFGNTTKLASIEANLTLLLHRVEMLLAGPMIISSDVVKIEQQFIAILEQLKTIIMEYIRRI